MNIFLANGTLYINPIDITLAGRPKKEEILIAVNIKKVESISVIIGVMADKPRLIIASVPQIGGGVAPIKSSAKIASLHQ